MRTYFLGFLTSFLFVLLMACQSAPKLDITSSTPARIENGGTTVCTTTPCEITAHHYVRGFGECVSGDNNQLEAFPLDTGKGFRQSKQVQSYCGQTTKVFFDMTSAGGVNTVAHSNDEKPGSSQSTAEKLKELKELKKQGLISEEEFKQKRIQILEKIK